MNTKFSAGGVVLNPSGQILIVSQGGKTWSLPKGHIEQGEDELTAAVREIREETGVEQLELIRKIGSYERFRMKLNKSEDKRTKKFITMFLFRTNQILLNPIDPHNPQAVWVNPHQAALLLTHPKDQEFLRNFIKMVQE
jgi:ADP-ribose pyrophosphatase YjhB (NUDIX family)